MKDDKLKVDPIPEVVFGALGYSVYKKDEYEKGIDTDAGFIDTAVLNYALKQYGELIKGHSITIESTNGGEKDQILAKKSNTDYDFEWIDNTGGGGSDIDARAQIKAVQGTTNWNDPVPISLTSAKATIDINTAKISYTDKAKVDANTAKISYDDKAKVTKAIADITTNVEAITLNTAKTGITSDQSNDIIANNVKVSYDDKAIVSKNTTDIATNVEAIALNTAKTGITTQQSNAITTNTAKVSYDDKAIVSKNTSDIAINVTNIDTKAPAADNATQTWCSKAFQPVGDYGTIKTVDSILPDDKGDIVLKSNNIPESIGATKALTTGMVPKASTAGNYIEDGYEVGDHPNDLAHIGTDGRLSSKIIPAIPMSESKVFNFDYGTTDIVIWDYIVAHWEDDDFPTPNGGSVAFVNLKEDGGDKYLLHEIWTYTNQGDWKVKTNWAERVIEDNLVYSWIKHTHNIDANTVENEIKKFKTITDIQTQLTTDTKAISTNVTAIALNTAKKDITPAQAEAIVTNSTKVSYTDKAKVTKAIADIATNVIAIAKNTAKAGITTGQAAEIVANTKKISYTDKAKVDANTAKISYTGAAQVAANKTGIATNVTAIAKNTAKKDITPAQAEAIVTNSTKVSYTDKAKVTKAIADIATNVIAIAKNTAKAGITTGQAAEIVANTKKISYTDKAKVDKNTAKVGITTGQANAIVANSAKIGYTGAAQVAANKSGIATNVIAIAKNTAKAGITTGQAAEIVANTKKISYTDKAKVDANTAKISYTGAAQVAANKTGIATNVTAIAKNTAKVGITPAQASHITTNNAKISYTDKAKVDANTKKISYTGAAQVAANKTGIATNVTAIAKNTAKPTMDSVKAWVNGLVKDYIDDTQCPGLYEAGISYKKYGRVINPSDGVQYKSLQNNNKGQNPSSSPTYWKKED